MFQAQNRETINSTWKVGVSFKIIMTTSVTRSSFGTQRQTCRTNTKTTVCKTKTKTDFWSQTGLVLRPTVSDHITANWGGGNGLPCPPPKKCRRTVLQDHTKTVIWIHTHTFIVAFIYSRRDIISRRRYQRRTTGGATRHSFWVGQSVRTVRHSVNTYEHWAKP